MAGLFSGLLGPVGGQSPGLFGMDPRTAGLISAAQALGRASGPSRVPQGTGAMMSNALAAGAGGYRQAQVAGFQHQMQKMKYDAAKRAEAAATLQTKYRQELAAAYATGNPALIRTATERLYPEKAAAQLLAKPTYKERDYPLKGGMVQKQISQDSGRTWTNSGEPYDRRNPYMPITTYDPDRRTVTQGVVDVRTIGEGQEQGGKPRVIAIGEKPPMRATGEESKSIGFSNRMLASNKILGGIEGQGADILQSILSNVPVAGNFLISGQRQRYEQAKRDFINAQLRKESGAAIAPHEFANAEKQYFPVPGDEPDTIAQKRANRLTALKSMEATAGVTYRRQEAAANLPPGAPTGAVLTELEDSKNPGVPIYRWTDSEGKARYWRSR